MGFKTQLLFLLVIFSMLTLETLAIRPEYCGLRHDRGPCKNNLQRYFFNDTSQACETFIYGGCRGNYNNFEFYTDCRQICVYGATVDRWN